MSEGWVDVASMGELRRRRKLLVEVAGEPVALFWHEDDVYALANTCIHKQRELVKGVILHGRVICPGHQWAFELGTGFNDKNCRYQPSYDVRVEDDRVSVSAAPRPAPEAAGVEGAACQPSST
ncbi:MAG: Rieske (2Fe-2S) protein [Actinomycetota bacterium]